MKLFCFNNKNESFKNISFIDQIGTFFENTIYFIKYVSSTKVDNPDFDTQIVEVSRCGYNMGDILINMGYEQESIKTLAGFIYQYKYLPIICIYSRIGEEKHIFLHVIGYYTDNTRDEVIPELKKIKEQLSELFYIK